MVRPNSVIPLGNIEDRPDYDFGDGVTLQVYEFTEGNNITIVIPSNKGDVDMSFDVKREGRLITVKKLGTSKRWQLNLVGIPSIASVEGGRVESSKNGVLVTSVQDERYLRISL
jgi:alpha-D-xyloside xylohydrolase